MSMGSPSRVERRAMGDVWDAHDYAKVADNAERMAREAAVSPADRAAAALHTIDLDTAADIDLSRTNGLPWAEYRRCATRLRTAARRVAELSRHTSDHGLHRLLQEAETECTLKWQRYRKENTVVSQDVRPVKPKKRRRSPAKSTRSLALGYCTCGHDERDHNGENGSCTAHIRHVQGIAGEGEHFLTCPCTGRTIPEEHEEAITIG